MSILPSSGAAVEGPSGGNIADVVGLILDKGLVIDAYVRVSLIGIEVLTIEARVVVASVDTYLRYAEAAAQLNATTRKPGLPELIQGVAGAASGLTGARSAAPARLGPPQETAPLPTGGGARSGHDEEPAALAARRGKGNGR